MRVAIGADHAGFLLKEIFIRLLKEDGHDVLDLGTFSADPVDYPDFALAVGLAVQDGSADRGILLCGSGAGVAVAANKMKGIRAAVCHDSYTAHQSVEHDDVNVLCIGPRVIGESLAVELARLWLNARFTGEERHVRRLRKVDQIEDMEAHS